MDIRTILI